ncbi:MAG TPA: metalloregulator ArsR/SmtB family transcription factor [Symbiobacteriaceae bacterium]|nr:metalloregulator ArsR/SmtB family transcription factor [Symbiobacteriaceae bacterium]
MIEQERVRQMITFRFSPLLDMALSLLVIQNPERFGTAPWEQRVIDRLPARLLDQLKDLGDQVDLFGLALDLENRAPFLPTPEQLDGAGPEVASLLRTYWEAISPEVGARAGVMTVSMQNELARLAQTDPFTFISRFSDRVSVAGDGDAIILHWGKGMRVPLEELQQILFIPSAFSPRRLMFYRLGAVQIFFYDPLHEEPEETAEPPESLVLGLSAMADATRLKLLHLIAREAVSAQEMARRLGLNESTVSRHLRLLVEAGLVGRDRQEGKFIIYSLQEGRIDQLASAAKAYLGRDR